MDQLKEFLRQAAKHRFWIAIGVACLLPLIAFFVATGSLVEEAKAEEGKIKAAHSDAQGYVSKTVENGQWKQAVEEKTAILEKDVDRSHRKLYNRQAPLLTWPKSVAEVIEKWGPTYPENVDQQRIGDVIQTYTEAYPEYVDEVYKSFKPFEPETGTGIVAAASKNALLRPEVYREDRPPALNDIWQAQRKLWIQRTMLDVVAKVNERAKAKSWDDAPVKQIMWLAVANDRALDQRTAAAGPDELVDPPTVFPKDQAPAEKAESTGTGRAANDAELGLGGLGAASAGSEPMKFIKSQNPDQYYVVPVGISVLVEQDKLPELLVEFRNSPMSIVVKDFKWFKPVNPVKKPRKGDKAALDAAAGAMGGRSMGGGLAVDEMGGMSDGDMSEMGMNSASSAYNAKVKGSGGMGRGFGATQPKTGSTRAGGKDVAAENLRKDAERKKKKGSEKDKSEEEEEEISSADPYFNLVEVVIRGQARFYQAPPKSEVVEPAPASNADAANADAPKAEAPKVEAPPATEAAKPGDAKGDPAKADAPKTDAKATNAPPAPDPAKADAPKSEPAKEAPKADAPKSDAPKADAPKGEVPKGDAPKDESTKADAPKGDTEKAKDAGGTPKG